MRIQNTGTSSSAGIDRVVTLLEGATVSKTSGSWTGVGIYPNINETGTTSNSILTIAPHEISVGSGGDTLLRLGTYSGNFGTGTFTHAFSVMSNGNVNLVAPNGSSTDSLLTINGGVVKKIAPSSTVQALTDGARSEERRVGKECRL